MNTRYILTPHRPMTDTEFCTWVGRAELGDILEYFRGYLALDTDTGARSDAQRKALRQLARRAVWAFDEGLVHLVQRRIGHGEFAYLAIRRPRPRTARTVRKRGAERAVAADRELEEAA